MLDNDYAADEFPTNTPIENLQVTIAHEYFHAVQFGYDIAEDPWFLEATAAWVEDIMYDRVDDNLQYLRQSPLRMPRTPMDTFGRRLPLRHLDLLPLPLRAATTSCRAGSRPSSAT